MLDTYRKTDLSLKLYESIQNIIRFADTKINFLSVINGIATSFVITNFQKLFSIGILSKVTVILYFISFILFVYFLLKTILPRGNTSLSTGGSHIIFFGHIAGRSNAKDFLNDFHNTTDEQFLDDLLQQIFESSKIADTKFKNYKKSLVVLQFQMFLFFILLGINSFQ